MSNNNTTGMEHAIDLLRRQVAVSSENAEIVAAAGDAQQAALDRAIAEQCGRAAQILELVDNGQAVSVVPMGEGTAIKYVAEPELQHEIDLEVAAQVQAHVDDDLNEPLGAACTYEGGPCESCQ